MFYSSNPGVGWETSNYSNSIFSLCWDGSTIFAGGEGLLQSTDNGATWKALNNNLSTTDIDALAMSDTSADVPTLFAGTDGSGVDISQDNGNSWNPVNTGLTDSVIYAIAVFGDKLFVGTDSGIFISINNGSSWALINDSLPPGTAVYSFTSDGSYLYAGTELGVYRRALSELNGAADAVKEPITPVSSLTAYPNPFSRSTTISFSSTESGETSVTILNILGSEVSRIFEGPLDAGTHSLTWSKSSALPAGMYECVVRTNGSVQQMPIVLIQ